MSETTEVEMDGRTYKVPRRAAHATAVAAGTIARDVVEEEAAAAQAASVGATAGDLPAMANAPNHIALTEIFESPHNPRKNFGELAELAASIRVHGVLQPVLVTPRYCGAAPGYSLVCGARRLRASKLAGLTSIPALVRVMTDQQIVEAQLVENCQRKDVEPLEEADALRDLRDHHGYSVEQLVERTGKTKAYVYAALKLTELGAQGRQELEGGRISKSVALAIARYPEHEQPAALQEVERLGADTESDQIAFREVQRSLSRNLTEELSLAPFDVAACASCPKRSGNISDQLEEMESADVCTDRACFAAKGEEAWQAVTRTQREAGRLVLTRAQSKAAMPYGPACAMPKHVSLRDPCDADPKRRTYAKLLGKRATDHVVVACGEYGGRLEALELLPKGTCKALLREAGHDFEKQREVATAKRSTTPSQWDVLDRVGDLFFPQVGPAVEQRAQTHSEEVLRWIASRLVQRGRGIDVVARGWCEAKSGNNWKIVVPCLLEHVAKDPLPVVLGLIAESLASDCGDIKDFEDPFWNACGLKPQELVEATRKQLSDELKAKAEKVAKKAAKKTKKGGKKKAAKKAPAGRKCRGCGCTDGDCAGCIERTGVPCTWVEADLCSACAGVDD